MTDHSPPVERAQRDLRGRIGVEQVRLFLWRVLRVDSEDIRGAQENIAYGDIICASGATLEVKCQPIDPVKHPQNFVEVMQHSVSRDDIDRVADTLGIDVEAWPVYDPHTGHIERLGRARVASSITSIAGAEFTFYVHPVGAWLYVYEREELLTHIAQSPRLVLGAGESNADTLAVFVPLAAMRWRGPDWTFDGDDDEAEARRLLIHTLGT